MYQERMNLVQIFIIEKSIHFLPGFKNADLLNKYLRYSKSVAIIENFNESSWESFDAILLDVFKENLLTINELLTYITNELNQ